MISLIFFLKGGEGTIDYWFNELALLALIIGLSIGLFAGFFSCYSYVKCTPAEKKRWEENRIMHHYMIGFFALLIGIISPLIAGMGIGLDITDIGDIRKRFSKEPSK